MTIRWCGAVGLGLVAAVLAGLVAWLVAPAHALAAGLIFAAATLPFGVAFGWIGLVAPKTIPDAGPPRDSAESAWMTRALAGMATDVMTVVGLGLAVILIARVDLAAEWALFGVLLVAFASVTIRYAMIRAGVVDA